MIFKPKEVKPEQKPIFQKKTASPIKPPTKKEEELVEAVYNEGIDEEEGEDENITKEDYDDFKPETEHQPEPQINEEYDKEKILLSLGELVRELVDIELQLKQQKIHWKSDRSMTGLMSVNELITLASKLKYDIKQIGDLLVDKCGMTHEILNERLENFAGEVKTYDFWLK